MRDLYCMSFTSRGTSEILVAGCQNTMYLIDVNKGEITKQVRYCNPAPYLVVCHAKRHSSLPIITTRL